jgi:NAD(P)-dependent dehydrogenase (short-subunit alcohol dehydrogenase family)
VPVLRQQHRLRLIQESRRGRVGDNPPMNLTGKIAVVTGAGSGIGRATAARLAREGAVVHAADLQTGPVEATVRDIAAAGGTATAHTVDVTDADAVQAFADAVYAADGRVDVLHNNAGIGHAGPTELTSVASWRAIIEVNVMGVAHGIAAFGPRMLDQPDGGHIVNTASLAGLVPVPLMVPYATSKHAVVGLSESLNAEWAKRGVRVTALCPGVINTPITRNVELIGPTLRHRERVVKTYERFGATADDVAAAVVSALGSRVIVRTVPRSHAALHWTLRRLSPRLAQPMSRLMARFIT